MKTYKRQLTPNAKKQRLLNRRRQVRRQKIFLLSIFLLAAILLLAFSGVGPLRKGALTYHINASCESYRSDVEQAAAAYDMSDYVDLLLALMMQESSGQGTDVMQSSEGAYNTRYPQTPNGITDADYSIACGIQELKYSMEKAGVTGPKDISGIQLALQGYNFGADVYFKYLEENQITTWSVASSEKFAEMASGETARSQEDPLYATAGPWDYGDQHYPEHVLRYYHP
ncbi:lysozyme family protein [Blautia sp. MSJ-19]|uniref:lysozyme family protein n=1 Tax=Blautia sp. MSJ-19 TaxID=2841517 RepID=UPI001C0EBEF0|nr:lysozyme family protein [Blautia sp. MSJ-19]MBU5481628.1 lysozyme family protein [Blautia sp. MSJ-19]